MPTTDAVRRGLAWGSIGFGAAALVAPGTLTSAYSMELTPEVGYFGRAWGSRNLAIGYWALAASTPAEKRAIDGACAVLNAVDAVVAAGATGTSGGSRVRAAVTSALFAAGNAWLALSDS